MSRLLRAAIVVVYFTTAAVAAPLINITIGQKIATVPSYFRVQVTIEPAPTNRWGCLYVVPLSTGDQVTSCWSLNGESEPRTFWRELKNLPPGRYDVNAAVVRNDEHSTVSTTVRILVMGPGLEPDPDTP